MAGHCMEYCSRKKKEKNLTKNNLLKSISLLKEKIGSLKKDNSSNGELQELYSKLEVEEAQLNELLDTETAGSIVRSRLKWAEHGEKSSKYFCNLEKRSYERKTIRQLKANNEQITTDPKRVLQKIHSFL